MNLDMALVREAQEVLGTTGVTETVHAALKDVVDRQRRRNLLDYDFPGLTLESLKELRRDRSFGGDEEVESA
jgi:Arc/MetJ family transcription regulator